MILEGRRGGSQQQQLRLRISSSQHILLLHPPQEASPLARKPGGFISSRSSVPADGLIILTTVKTEKQKTSITRKNSFTLYRTILSTVSTVFSHSQRVSFIFHGVVASMLCYYLPWSIDALESLFFAKASFNNDKNYFSS